MCTVTYIPYQYGFYLTSNRDESPTRIAEAPVPYEFWNGACRVVFPRDAHAGGSWIAMASGGQVACLLNGAFVNHRRQPPYRKSRGLVLMEYFEGYSPLAYASLAELHQIEPFTLLLIDRKEFCELRYDGRERHIRVLSKDQPYIWSSATLYNADETKQKEQRIMSWLDSKPQLNAERIMEFHGLHNPDGYLLHKPQVKTVSITSIHHHHNVLNMHYADLQFESIIHSKLSLDRAQAPIS